MKLTIGIISCNRFKYLKSLIHSLSILKKQDNDIEIIVADNSSLERGLRDYLEQMLTNKIIDNLKINLDYDSTNGEYIARNIIIKESTKENILIIDEEYQFIGTYNLLKKYVEDFTNSDYISMDIFGKRNSKNPHKLQANKMTRRIIVMINHGYWN